MRPKIAKGARDFENQAVCAVSGLEINQVAQVLGNLKGFFAYVILAKKPRELAKKDVDSASTIVRITKRWDLL